MLYGKGGEFGETRNCMRKGLAMAADTLSAHVGNPEPSRGAMDVSRDMYFAGLIDGEGTITITFTQYDRKGYGRGSKHSVLVHVGMTDERPIYALQRQFGGTVKKWIKKNPKWSDIYIWRVYSAEARECLKRIRPYLMVKQEQADICLEFFEKTVTTQREVSKKSPRARQLPEHIYQIRCALVDRIRPLNFRGPKAPRACVETKGHPSDPVVG